MNVERDSRKIIARLETEGWKLVRVRGSHHHFKRTDREVLITIPHPKKDLPGGLVRDIYKKAGWS